MQQQLFPLHVMNTDVHGKLELPSGIRSVIYEIGCSDRDTVDEKWIDYFPRSYLISFEPLIEKYAALLARGNTRYHGDKLDRAVPLSHHHKRGIVLPLAVAPSVAPNGLSTMTIGAMAGCSSVMAVNRKAQWGHGCKESIERRTVPTINVSAALALTTLPISLLKVDAQGLDFRLVRALSVRELQRIRSIDLEVRGTEWPGPPPRKQCEPLYEGQETCEEVVAYMASRGFVNRSACPPHHKHHECERSIRFDQREPAVGSASSSHQPSTYITAKQWLQAARPGHCLPSVVVGFAGDCEHGLAGDLAMDEDPSESLSFLFSVRQCLTRCLQCARCEYVSLSLTARICSWHAHCTPSNLTHINARVQTGPWDHRTDRGYVSGLRPSG